MEFENENINAQPRAYAQLEELGHSDYEIRDGEPDITGWSVFNHEGNKIGEVQDMLFDPEARKVRYIVLELQANGQDVLDDDRLVLIPIGVAKLYTGEEQVTIPLASAEPLAGLPTYTSGSLTPETEMKIRQVFEGGSTAPYAHPQFYAHAHFNEDHFYNREALPDNTTIIPAEAMDDEASAVRAEKAGQIVDRLNQSDEEPKSTEFPQGKVVGEFESIAPENVTTEFLERENSQPVEETGINDYRLNEGFSPEPESIEQEEAWQEEQAVSTGNSKLMEFFVNELKDLLWAEQELEDTLPDMAEAATSQELKNAFTNHRAETQTHIVRLKQIFGILGLEPETTKCDAMAGIVEEGDEIISDTEEGTAQRDVGLIFAGQKAEHYEIASYGGLISLAKTLGYYEIAELLVLTIDEEKSADALLTEIAENHVNYEASTERADD
jgi:ferritin-like metal-binding protein YciE